MHTQNSHVRAYGRYVGRVGALAAALGIGVLVVASPSVASADTPSPSPTSSDVSGDNSATAGSPTTNPGTGAIHRRKGFAAAFSAVAGAESATTDGPASRAAGAPTNGVAAPGHRLTLPNLGHLFNHLADPSTTTVGQRPTDVSDAPEHVTTPSATQVASRRTTSTLTNVASRLRSEPTTVPSLPGIVAAVQRTAHSPEGSAGTPAPVTAATAASTVQTLAASRTLTTQETAAPDALTTPITQIATRPVAFLNQIVTNLLNPFLGSAPSTPGPVVPITWAVLGWVRRNVFNEAPTIAYNPTTTVQTGQTVTGNIGATDPEGDKLTYAVTQKPTNGTVTVDQATGIFTYTPNKIDYTGTQTDSFTVSATDGKTNLLSVFGQSHSAQSTVDITVQPPTAVRTIVPLPADFTDAQIPRFAADGKSLLFSATPPNSAANARLEIYHVNVDGTGLSCVTCGLADPTPPPASSTRPGGTVPNTPNDLFKPVPFEDGSGRILMQSVATSGTAPGAQGPTSVAGSYTYVVYDPTTQTLARVITPPGKPGVVVIDPQREMRVSPDGTHVLFSQIQLVPNPTDPPGFSTAVPIVGTLAYDPANKVYNITDARVVAPVGEGKQFTHDGKGVIVQGGLYDAGNVDDIEVDLATGKVTRLTGNLDYDEDADLSPNNQWIAIDSGRGQEMLTPASRIVRPAFVPLLIQGSVYTAYAGTSNAQNVTNQPSVIAVADDLNREDGLPLYVDGDGWTARSMPSWSADGTEVAFWEANAAGQSRLVVANLQYTTSAATPLTAEQQKTPVLADPTVLPTLATNTPQQVPLPPAGTVAAPKVYTGAGGGTAAVSETTDPTTGHIKRTVTYTHYVNEQGMVLDGFETTDQSAAQNTIHYTADVQVSGTHTGSLTGDVTINKLTRTITPTTATSQIQSTLDGDTQVLFATVGEARANV